MTTDAAYLLGVIQTIAQEHANKCRCLTCKIDILTQQNLGYVDVINPFELVSAAKKFIWTKEYG